VGSYSGCYSMTYRRATCLPRHTVVRHNYLKSAEDVPNSVLPYVTRSRALRVALFRTRHQHQLVMAFLDKSPCRSSKVTLNHRTPRSWSGHYNMKIRLSPSLHLSLRHRFRRSVVIHISRVPSTTHRRTEPRESVMNSMQFCRTVRKCSFIYSH
jgi:hypothetical protein